MLYNRFKGDSMDYKLEEIKGVGPQVLNILRNHKIWSTYDLVLNVPKGYHHFMMSKLSSAKHKDTITVRAIVKSTPRHYRFGGKKERVTFNAEIDSSIVEIIVFGRGYLAKTLTKESEILIKGTYHLYKHQISASNITKVEHADTLKPIYGIEGIFDANLNQIIKHIFDEKKVKIYETLPFDLIKEKAIISREEAYMNLHFPKDQNDIKQAIKRFKYEEAFFVELKMLASKPNMKKRPPKAYDISKVKQLISTLPYELTDDQKMATNDIFRDFKKHQPCYRLIQGDVGSGKTVVSLIACYAVVTANEQVAIMAPTELLASQHYDYFKKHLKDVRIALLSSKVKDKAEVKRMIKDHEIDLVIGTHALIEDDVVFSNLGLVVIDEQHKFGVETREDLLNKSLSKDLLYLTATPIPRTLAMLAFGDTHVSIIKEKPQSRLPILTRYILKTEIDALYQLMASALIRKEHIILVVPAIDSLLKTDNVETVFQSIRSEFPNANIFTLHGKKNDIEKDETMREYIQTKGSILIATTMVEVGIDIPTATVIGIYSAESFGLSQLHQLRGRVGRGDLASYCVLISEKEDIERLEVLTQTDDGFKLANFDLKERGPGDFLGKDQSGFVDFNYLDIILDEEIIMDTLSYVEKLFQQDDFHTNPKYQYLRKILEEKTHMM
jgi:ATP-dependent DNA helicase RecG